MSRSVLRHHLPNAPRLTLRTLLQQSAQKVVEGIWLQAAFEFVRLSNCYHRRRAYPMILKSGTPMPLFSFGEQAIRQATRHCPPVVDSVPLQRNDR